jgi:hypothetical protein
MGLLVSHGCFAASYSNWHAFCDLIAHAAGYDSAEARFKHYGLADGGHVWGFWYAFTPQDPLDVMLVHADNDGIIHAGDAKRLADRLTELLPQIHQELRGRKKGDFEGWTEQFIAGLRIAVERGEWIVFA